MDHHSILLIEDNKILGAQIHDYLSAHGFMVDYSPTGGGGLKLAAEHQFDAVILDLMLPDIDGLDVCHQLKQTSVHHIPVLMLTALGSLENKREGFAVGADDYLAKPFDLEELLMRCQALVRRPELHASRIIKIDDLIIDLTEKSVTRSGQVLELTQIGFQILQVLAQAHPQAVSRSQLMKRIWGDESPDSDSLRSHIYSLRNKVDKPFDKPLIATIHGVGFKLA